METKAIQINDKTLYIKPGLKGLIQLAKISNLNEAEHFEQIILWGLWPQEVPQLTIEEKKQLARAIMLDIEIPHPAQIEEWYSQGLGEIGLPLSTFNSLTPYELDLAYLGYLRRMELSANSTQLAVLHGLAHNTTPISLVPPREITRGSLEERKAVFKNLRIEEIL